MYKAIVPGSGSGPSSLAGVSWLEMQTARERAVRAVRSRDILVAIESPERTPLNTWRGLKKIENRHYDVLRELMGLPPEMT